MPPALFYSPPLLLVLTVNKQTRSMLNSFDAQWNFKLVRRNNNHHHHHSTWRPPASQQRQESSQTLRASDRCLNYTTAALVEEAVKEAWSDAQSLPFAYDETLARRYKPRPPPPLPPAHHLLPAGPTTVSSRERALLASLPFPRAAAAASRAEVARGGERKHRWRLGWFGLL